MCKSKMALRASQPIRNPNNPPSPKTPKTPRKSSSRPDKSSSIENTPKSPLSEPFSNSTTTTTSSSYLLDTSIATTSASTSLSTFRDTLPENTQIYNFSDIRTATNNFLAKRLTSSSSAWRCTLHGKDVVILQRKLRKCMSNHDDIRQKLSVINKSHYTSIIKLLGVSVSGPEHIYLVYEYVSGSSLSSCLRNKINPNFTVLSSWMSRMQIATDLAHGLEYIHNTAGLSIDMVHKHVKSSGVIVTEPHYNAKICHFGAAELCGETSNALSDGYEEMQFEGARGYMSPEFKTNGVATQKTDVYAFGVVLLELITGEEPVKYGFDRMSGDYRVVSVIDTAKEVMGEGGNEGDTGLDGRIRRWVDKRLKDSFPVEAAVKLTRVALQCVQEDTDKRPDMKWVAGKISKIYLGSKIWCDRVKAPVGISVSLGPR